MEPRAELPVSSSKRERRRHIPFAVTFRFSVLTVGAVFTLTQCSAASSGCESGACAQGGLVLNELAGTGDDFVELFNASDRVVDLSGYGLADDAGDGGVRFSTAVRVPEGTSIAARGYFTFFLETDCPSTVSPCGRGEFGISQSAGDTLTLLDARNGIVADARYPASAAEKGFSLARVHDGAETFAVQRRSPGTANAP